MESSDHDLMIRIEERLIAMQLEFKEFKDSKFSPLEKDLDFTRNLVYMGLGGIAFMEFVFKVLWK